MYKGNMKWESSLPLCSDHDDAQDGSSDEFRDSSQDFA